MTIPTILRENARSFPDRPALIATERRRDVAMSFEELQKSTESFASSLSARGIGRGHAVLVFVPMSLELYIALLAIFRIGATAVFIDPSSGLAHINACCAMLPPRALIAVWPLRWVRPFVSGLRRIPRVIEPPKRGELPGCKCALEDPSTDEPALVTFTSGSTGRPKATVRTHRFLIAQHQVLKRSIALVPGERDLTTLPVFVLANLASGVTSILPDAKISDPGKVDATKVSEQISRLHPTRTGGSPAFFQRLIARPKTLASFTKIYTGGAPVFPAMLQELQRCAEEATVVAVYGSTEAEPIAHVACDEISPVDWTAMRGGKGLLAGVPVPEIQLRIVADQFGEPLTMQEPMPAGSIGEIVVTGDHVLKSYLNGHGDTDTKVQIGGATWHRTGDAGYLDEAGRLWLMGRCSAKIQRGSVWTYPFAVECVAMSHAFVRRAALMIVRGKRVLVVQVETGISASEIALLEASVDVREVDELRRVKEIPVDRRHNAKVDYPRLARMLR